MGMLYLRGKTWWAKYYIAGPPVRRSCKTEKETVARKLLRHWEGNAHLALPTMDRVTVAGLLDAVVADQEAQGRRSVHHTRRHKADLCAYFTAERKAVSLSRADLDAYVVQRLGQGVSRGTIGRELAILRRGFRLALENKLVSRAPPFPPAEGGHPHRVPGRGAVPPAPRGPAGPVQRHADRGLRARLAAGGAARPALGAGGRGPRGRAAGAGHDQDRRGARGLPRRGPRPAGPAPPPAAPGPGPRDPVGVLAEAGEAGHGERAAPRLAEGQDGAGPDLGPA